MGKPRVKLPTLASRNTVTCIDVTVTSRNLSVSTPTHHIVSHCLAPSSVEPNLRQQQQPSLSSTVTDLNAANIYRTSTPTRYEDWLPVKNHLIYISDDDSLDNCFLRLQEDHFVRLHYNFTYETVTPRWTNIPPPSECATSDTFIAPNQVEQFRSNDVCPDISYKNDDVPADSEVHTLLYEDYPTQQFPVIQDLPQALLSSIELAVPYDVSNIIECEFEPVELTNSTSCSIQGSSAAIAQRGSEGQFHYRAPYEDRRFGDTSVDAFSIPVPYNYKRRRRR